MPFADPSDTVILHFKRRNYITAVDAAYDAIMAPGDSADPGIGPKILLALVEDTLRRGPKGTFHMDERLASIANHLTRREHLTETARIRFLRIAHARGFRATETALQKRDDN